MYQAFLGQWLSEFWLLFLGTSLYKYQQANQPTKSINVYVIQDYLSEGESETHDVSGVKSLPPWAPCGGGRLKALMCLGSFCQKTLAAHQVHSCLPLYFFPHCMLANLWL